MPAGMLSVMTRSPKNALGPPFETLSVQSNGTPITTSAGEGPDFAIARSAVGVRSAVPPSVAVLFDGVGSVGEAELIVAVFVTPADALATVTGTVIAPSD